MKRKITFRALVVFFAGLMGFSLNVHGQGNTFPTTGSVGIGTTSPIGGYKLDIRGGLSAVGGESRFSVGTFTDPWPAAAFGIKVGGGGMAVIGESRFSTTGTFTDPHLGAAYTLKVGGGGVAVKGNSIFMDNVGIGTTTPTDKLSVNGRIRAKEVKVETANWPDYVFDPDYALRSIPELEAYIRTHGHLPGIPTAAEVEKEGLALGEMNRKLVEKVEELSLYVIELKKEVDALKNQSRGNNVTQ